MAGIPTLHTRVPGNHVQIALLLLLAVSLSARERELPVMTPPPALVGQWQGYGRLAVPWTTVQTMPVNVIILPDGTVTGQVGLASIVGGGFSASTKKKKPPYVLTVTLEGALLEDGILRRCVRFHLGPEGARLIGTGDSDGVKTYPLGAIREYVRRFGRVEVVAISLSKHVPRAAPAN